MNEEKVDLCEPARDSIRGVVSAEAIIDLIRRKKLDGQMKGEINRNNLIEWSVRHNLMHSVADLIEESSTRETALSNIEKWDAQIGSAVCGLFEFDTVFNVYVEEILRLDNKSSYELFHAMAHKLPGNFYRATETEFAQCLVYRRRALKCALAGEHAVAMTLLRSALESALKGSAFLSLLSPRLTERFDFRDGNRKVGLSEMAEGPFSVDEKYLKSFRNMLDMFAKIGILKGSLRRDLSNEYSLMSSLSHSDPILIMAVLSDELLVKPHTDSSEPDDFSRFIPNLQFANDVAAYCSLAVLDLILDRDLLRQSLPVEEDSPPLSVLFYAGGLNRTISKFESMKAKAK